MDANGNSEARIAWGNEFWLEDTPGGTLTELGEVTGIPTDSDEAEEVDVTHFKSPERRRETKAGLSTPSSGDLMINYLPGSPTEAILRQAAADRLVRAYREIIPDEAGDADWQVDGYLWVKSRGRPLEVGGVMRQTISVKFTGSRSEQAAS
ncbi:phage tail tube protein [Stakelama tenebrarum]|uniref:Lambda phage tail tube protein N-terminal domain-containing protein n=1 Tax=Stakelama tenebrarum TaxID=2711215 RepID=A0A6G6Y5D5_9SPHN|nr:phage tail tube protein [Sphingosinithalassobacter tenebrarum]QIG80109.1 hypothetical protein G5C33_10175 [Sphingosinithalassobacter tenebrarum]